MSKRPASSETLKFTVIALIMMILVKVFVVDGIHNYLAPAQDSAPPQPQKIVIEEVSALPKNNPVVTRRAPQEIPAFDFTDVVPQPDSIDNVPEPVKVPLVTKEAEIILKPETPPVAIPKPQWDGKTKAKIALIIDDMGMSRGYTQDVVDLPAPMTLAFLPYAENLDEFTIPAKKLGHELIIHVPMEPMNADLDLGPAGLTTDLEKEEFIRRMEKDIFPSFEGYVGINNHMGSKLTQNKQSMGWLMPLLKERGLLFVDSKTIHSSVAAKTAHEFGVDYAERDVFLDHVDDLQAVINALTQLEQVAKRNGQAIAIGHPKKNTIEALRLWMPTMEERGLELVPVSDLVQKFEHDRRQEEGALTFWNELGAIPGRPHSEVRQHALPPG